MSGASARPGRALGRRVALVPAVAAVVVTVLVGGPVAAAGVQQEPDPTPTTTAPPPTAPPPTVPTTAPVDAPVPPTTPPAAPPPATIPDDPNGEHSALSPEQTIEAEAELASLTDAQRALLRQLQNSRDNLAIRRFALVGLAREVEAAQARLAEARAAEEAAQARVDETRAQLDALKRQIVALAAAAYRNHTETWVLGSLSTIDPGTASTVSRAKTYAQSDVAFLNQQVATLTVLERRLAAAERRAEETRVAAETSANDLDARLAEQKQAYDDAADAAAKARAAAARSLGSDARLVAQMLDPRFGSDGISAVLAYAQAGQGEPFTLEAIFSLPIPGASLSSPFGLRIHPVHGTVAFHAGLDFAADMRTPIRASADGLVVMASECGGYGNCVVIDHGASLATLYGHQSQMLVGVGDRVAKGQVIGLVGSTGISTGPHLHFEVRFHGAPIDPVPTLHA